VGDENRVRGSVEAAVPGPVGVCCPWRRAALPWTFILLGAALRVAWPLDFEWKGDERWFFEASQRIARGQSDWPWVGMPSSVGVSNPGFGIWPFIGLYSLFRTPDGMTLGVMVLNGVALLGLAAWVWFTWPEEDRWWGHWAIALFAVSPLPLLFSRKLWPHDLFPLFLVPFLWAHARRDRPGAAFVWGLLGALLGQLHMSGFFAAAGLATGSWITARKGVRWVPWVWGSVLGVLPLFPWMWNELHRGAQAREEFHQSVEFFLLAWKYAWGVGLDYSLGKETAAFLAGPWLAGVGTGLLRGIQVTLWILSLYAAATAFRNRHSITFPIAQRPLLWGVLIGGSLFQLLGLRVHAHYLIVWSPVFHIAAAWMLSRSPRLLALTTALQLCLSLGFLCYVHENEGARDGDYGVTYRVQCGGSPGAGEE